jgi:hypothetical protein
LPANQQRYDVCNNETVNNISIAETKRLVQLQGGQNPAQSISRFGAEFGPNLKPEATQIALSTDLLEGSIHQDTTTDKRRSFSFHKQAAICPV